MDINGENGSPIMNVKQESDAYIASCVVKQEVDNAHDMNREIQENTDLYIQQDEIDIKDEDLPTSAKLTVDFQHETNLHILEDCKPEIISIKEKGVMLASAYVAVDIKQEPVKKYEEHLNNIVQDSKMNVFVKQEFQELTNIKREDLFPSTIDCSVNNANNENRNMCDMIRPLYTIEPGFQEATSSTLPSVTMDMIHDFYIDHYLSSRGVKVARKKRENYGDSAIEYVQLSRQNNTVSLKCKVAREDGVNRKFYNVTVIINEMEQEIVACQCLDCIVEEGGCTHAIAFLYWLHRRTEEPSPEEQRCYWKKPKLNNENEQPVVNKIENFNSDREFNQIIHIKNESNATLFKSLKIIKPTADLRNLMYHLKNNASFVITADIFINFCQNQITLELCDDIFRDTAQKTDSDLWHKLRFARITASMFDQACVGYLYGVMSTSSRGHVTKAMERGKRLKEDVLEQVADMENITIVKTGLQLLPENPIFGATPDGVTEEYCIQVKCPSKKSTVRDYISRNKVQERFLSQIMLQMYLCKKPKGLFCVASPNFEYTRDVDIVEVDYDEHFLIPKLEKAMFYWKRDVFPKLFECV